MIGLRGPHTTVALALALVALQPAPRANSTTTLVSVNRSGTASGNGVSKGGVITPDGRFVLFQSTASDLVAHDTNGTTNVFVRDLRKGRTFLVSVNHTGTDSSNGDSEPVGITPNGRFVAFTSLASDLVANDTNGFSDVFVRDLKKRTTTLVSVNRAGTASGNGFSAGNAITPDGRFVLFGSYATDLVDGHTTGPLFVRDLKKGITTLVSVDQAGTATTNPAFVGITPNGRFVVFDVVVVVSTSFPSPCCLPPIDDVFVRDLKKRTTTLVDVNRAGTARALGYSAPVGITPNGRFVAFDSDATDLLSTETNGAPNVFVRDLQKETTLVSVNQAGTAAGDYSVGGAITPSGRFVLFGSFNFTSNLNTVFVRDLKKRTTAIVSVNNGYLVGDAITPNGRFVLFDSNRSGLPNDVDLHEDVFLRDLKRGRTKLVSVNRAGTGGGNYASLGQGITANGRFIVLDSFANDLVANDTNGHEDVFVRDLL